MKIVDSYEARKELEASIGKVKAAAAELQRVDIYSSEKFKIIWHLAFVDLQKLEDFRIPEQEEDVMNARDLRFRAWVKDKRFGQEVFDVIMITFPVGREILLSGKGGSVNADDCELMQSTGLLDKNGVEIYEDDIVCYGYTGIIKHGFYYVQDMYDCGDQTVYGYYVEAKNARNDGTVFDSNENMENHKHMEVIGNIYQNPDLIKQWPPGSVSSRGYDLPKE